jgi:hypothetical protein
VDVVVVTGDGVVTRAMLDSGRRGLDERGVAGRLCRACVDGLDVDGAAVSLLTGSASRVTVAVTDPVAQMLEDLQFTHNEGACMQAAGSGRPVLVADLRDRTLTAAWPLFADAVLEGSAVAALFALPLQWGAVNLGVLDLYRLAPGSLDDAQWRDAAAAVDTATLLMLGRRTLPAVRGSGGPGRAGAGPQTQAEGIGEGAGDGSSGWLAQVTGYRAEIHQATGMVQVQLGIAGVDALARMRGFAFARQRLLIDVARDVVARELRFTEEMP